ncbi:hypothetical protein LTR85_011480 [Meristemomyces frigidus]|nr:hypothetical protein LTR85_011480 [Meristemomyces frigidus]
MASSSTRSGKQHHAFPIRQMMVLGETTRIRLDLLNKLTIGTGLCRVCEPIAFMSIFPYIYYMIESFHITKDDKQIALYAGLVTSAFAFAECLAGPFWGRLSDKYGRKPILLTGIAGTGVSMLLFGFARNLPTALIARALGGILNGNIGVLQTTVAEVITVEAHQARAYAIMPFVWCIGSIVGSAMGGALADPVRNYPSAFSDGTIFERYPYLLTNLVCAAVVAFSLTIGLLFLEETHEDKKDRKDIGREMGEWIMAHLGRASVAPVSGRKPDYTEETLTLMMEEDLPPHYSSTASSPALPPTLAESAGLPPPAYRSIADSPRNSEAGADDHATLSYDVEEALLEVERQAKRAPAVSSAFTRQVVYNIIGFGILA